MKQISTHGSVTYYLILVWHQGRLCVITDFMRGTAGIAIDGNIDSVSKYWICILTLKWKKNS